ncbi:MAG: phosphate ABC transporter permease subunit PstC, partial [Armatimonadota bacterium]
MLLSAASVGIIGVILIFLFVGKEALPILTSKEVHQEVTLLSMFNLLVWQPVSEIPKYSMIPLLVGTIKVTAIAIILGTPIAIGAAIFTAEFASHRVRELVKPFIEMLAGFPSVVLGFLALMVMATLLQK